MIRTQTKKKPFCWYIKDRDNLKRIISILLPILCMALLTIPNLGNREMWIDEAHNAALATRILKYGYPRVWDGDNMISYAFGVDFSYGFTEMLLNWFPYYLAALGSIFTKNLFCLRLPFVLLGICSAIFLYLLVSESTKNKKISLIALWIYCLSTPVLIYIRVAYYYAPSLFFINLSTCLFFRFKLRKNSKVTLFIFTISMIFLYYTNYLFFGILLICLFVDFFLFYIKNKCKEKLRAFITSAFFIGAFTLPFQILKFIYISKFGSFYEIQGLSSFFLQLSGQFWQIQTYFLPFVSFFLFFILKKILSLFNKNTWVYKYDHLHLKNKLENKRFIFFCCMIILVNAIAVSYFTKDFATRYLIISIPFCSILSSIFIHYFFSKDRIFGMLFLVVLLFTNIINELPYFLVSGSTDNELVKSVVKPPVPFYFTISNPVPSNLKEYINNLEVKSNLIHYCSSYLKDFDNFEEGVVRFFKKYLKDSDETIFNMGGSQYNLMYYMDFKFIYTEQDPDDLIMNYNYDNGRPITAGSNLKFLKPVYKPVEFADWVIVDARDIKEDDSVYKVGNLFYNFELSKNQFEKFEIFDYPISVQTADIWFYYFETLKEENHFAIFRNKLTTDPIDAPNIITKEYLESTD